MWRLSKTVFASIGMVVFCVGVSPIAFAAPSSNLKIMIFPLECSVDLMNVGVGVYKNLTPENCLDPIEDPYVPDPVIDGVDNEGQAPGSSGVASIPSLLRYPALSVPPNEVIPASDMPPVIFPAIPLANHVQSDNIKSLPGASSSLTLMTIVIMSVPLIGLSYIFVRWLVIRLIVK